jgi:hypothetical protein
MRNVSDVLQIWSRSVDLARELNVSPPRITDWKNRNSIPPAYWRDIVNAACRRGHTEVSADLLADLHARNAKSDAPGFGEEEERAFQIQSDGGRASSNGRPEPVASGHFSRFKHLRRSHFASAEEVNAHVSALRDEWDRR